MTEAFSVRLAKDAEDIAAAQRLRYEVFVTELGGDGALVDHEARLERDERITTETLALFVRFWLTITPPIAGSTAAISSACFISS